jgi:polysaccharide export outer membrane protein
MLAVSNAYAAELDHYDSLRQEELTAKQARVNDLGGRIEVLQKQLEDERQTAKRSQEKIWKDFTENMEAERKSLKDQIGSLDERQVLFENELAKKQEQDEVRVREKENEIQRMMFEVQRLRGELEEDRKIYDQDREVREEQRRKNAVKPARQPDVEIGASTDLENGAIKIGQTTVGETIGGVTSRPRDVQPEYYVEIGDVLDIDVWRVADLSRSVPVRPDGRISMPVVGDLNVVGLTLVDVRQLLTEKFADYVWNPQVSISIRQFGGRKFIIMGEIGSPGVYRYQQDISLLEAIALAGGFNPDSKEGKIMVIRGDIKKSPKVKMISANLQNLFRKGILSENIAVMPNDIIYVGKDFLGDYQEILDDIISPTFDSIIDFFVLRSAIRTAQDRRN